LPALRQPALSADGHVYEARLNEHLAPSVLPSAVSGMSTAVTPRTDAPSGPRRRSTARITRARRVGTFLLVGLFSVLPVVALTAALLIVVPAPSYLLALASVAATEKSFVPGLLGLILAVAAGFVLRGRARILVWPVRVAGVLALLLSCLPPMTAFRVARAQGTRLDLGRYLLSSFDHHVGRAPATAQYAEPGGRPLFLDVYPAAGADQGPRRSIVVIHGGGWSAGDKGEGSRASSWLAQQGFHVFDVQYRLAPQGRWSEALGDVKCAVAWVKSEASRRFSDLGVKVDPARVALMGRSAGGQLALLAAFAADDPTLPATCANGADASVDAVISFYGPTDLRWGYQNPASPHVYDTSDRLRGFLGGPPSGVGDPYDRASPTERAHGGAPPVLLIHGGKDQFVSPLHIPRLQARLAPLGVWVQTLEIPYARHGFDMVFGGLGGQLAEAAVLRFLADVDARKSGHATRR
jgi:acetyl esterase/lipase